MQSQTLQLNAYLAALNDEADVALVALDALRAQPVAAWSEVLSQHPEWCRFGPLDALLAEAHGELDNDAHRSLAIVAIVLTYAATFTAAPQAEFLRPLLVGTALKERASALYMLEEYDHALPSSEEALATLADLPEFAVDRAAVLLVYAQIQHERDETARALEAVREAADTFESHAQPARYMMALEVCGQILMDQHEYASANDVYATAYVVAERMEDAYALVRLDNNLGLCAVYLHALDEARYRLARAFSGLEERGMYEAMQRTILNLAREARASNNLDDALDTLHAVYADFLHRGKLRAAAQVLVEVGDTVTELTGDVAFARKVCRQLAETMGVYDAPRNVRAAAEYLRATTEGSSSVTVLRAAFAHVRSFLQQFAGSPTTAFAVPR